MKRIASVKNEKYILMSKNVFYNKNKILLKIFNKLTQIYHKIIKINNKMKIHYQNNNIYLLIHKNNKYQQIKKFKTKQCKN